MVVGQSINPTVCRNRRLFKGNGHNTHYTCHLVMCRTWHVYHSSCPCIKVAKVMMIHGIRCAAGAKWRHSRQESQQQAEGKFDPPARPLTPLPCAALAFRQRHHMQRGIERAPTCAAAARRSRTLRPPTVPDAPTCHVAEPHQVRQGGCRQRRQQRRRGRQQVSEGRQQPCHRPRPGPLPLGALLLWLLLLLLLWGPQGGQGVGGRPARVLHKLVPLRLQRAWHAHTGGQAIWARRRRGGNAARACTWRLWLPLGGEAAGRRPQ